MHSHTSKTRLSLRVAALALALAVTAPASNALAATAVYTVTAQKVNVRAQPDTDAEILAVVRKGSDLTLISSDEDGWLKVSTGGQIGYVSAEYAVLSDIISGSGTLTATVDTKKLYLRDSPSSSGQSLALLERGTVLTVTSRSGDWLAVSYNGQSGYISSQYVRLNGDNTAQSSAPAATTTTTSSGSALSVGSRGDAVKSLQQKLINLGYLSGSADGIFGQNTKKAVAAFQSAKGLTASGAADAATLNALNSAGTSSSTGTSGTATSTLSESSLLKKGDSGEAVRTLQLNLISLGYLTGEADGQFGPATKSAVTAFQAASGLRTDGQAGEKTLEAIADAVKAVSNAGTLKKGSRGDAVKALQQKLIALGYLSGSADGIFGESTLKAVIAFQTAQSLTADGAAGSSTIAALNKAYQGGTTSGSTVTAPANISNDQVTIVSSTQPSSYPTIKYGAEGDAVEKLQTRLKELGYFDGTVGGNFGTITRAAVIAFQKAANLSADGIVGSDTWTALYSKSAPTASSTSAPSNPVTTTTTSSSGSTINDTDYSTGEKIVALAKQYLGCKYVYARENPPYFDCSGLTQYVYKQFGYSLKRTAYLQGYDDTWPKITSISDLQVGDLIYFNTNETDADLSDHAAIYIGDGNFIHASSSAGKVVISSLSSGYYKTHFSWGRRVLNQ